MMRRLRRRHVGFGFDFGPIHVSTEHGVNVDNPGQYAAHMVHDLGSGIGKFLKDPVGTTGHVLEQAKNFAEGAVHEAAGALSLIPGVGTAISSALETGLAILDGGSPLDIAIHAAYGAIPIPPGVKDVTDHVLGVILSLAHSAMSGAPLTDAMIQATVSQLPKDPPIVKSVADTLLHLVVGALSKHPTQHTLAKAVQHASKPLPKPSAKPAPLPVKPIVPLALVRNLPHLAIPSPAAPHAMAATHVQPPGSPGAPPGATHWACTPGPGGTWACHWV